MRALGRAILPADTLPTGVTLQAIDGETMLTATTMSHSFWGGRGLTALTNTAYNAGTAGWWQGLSWDDPKFFQIAIFWANTGSATDSNGRNFTQRLVDIGINTCWRVDGSATQLTAGGIWVACDDDEFFNQFSTSQTMCIGFAIDEPSMINGPQSSNTISNGQTNGGVPVAGPVNQLNSAQDTRAWFLNFTWSAADIVDSPANQGFMPAYNGSTNLDTFRLAINNNFVTPSTRTRYIDVVSVDQYYFAAAPIANQTQWHGIGYAGTVTTDLQARGSHYGDLIDWFRVAETTNKCINTMYIETGDSFPNGPNSATSMVPISPKELHWAFWSIINHGGRGIALFTPTSGNTATGEPSVFGINSDALGNAWWQATHTAIDTIIPRTAGQWTVSMYDQLKADCQNVGVHAQMINSPFALNYATVSPARYVFPTMTRSLANGIDICAHLFNHQFWIIATTSYSETATSISATFTVGDAGAFQAVGFIDAPATTAIVSGSFTVTFAHAWDVHIFKILSTNSWG